MFRSGVDLVHVGVTVTDRKGNLVADLTADDFSISEAGKAQVIRYFTSGESTAADRPEMHLGLLLDVSESMGGDMKFTKTAAVKFLLKASDVTVYAIGELEHQSRAGANEARSVLHRIAGATGGQAFFPLSVKELDGVYDKVLAEIRAQYIIGYLSSNEKADGAWRKLEIKVTGQADDHVRSRQGYFAQLKK